jgi:hypothetical protein
MSHAPNGSMQVYDVTKSPYNAVGDGVTDDTAAIQNAILDAETYGPPGAIVWLPPTQQATTTPPVSAKGYLVTSGMITISSPNIILAGAGGMGAAVDLSDSTTGFGTSTIIGSGNGGHTITIKPGSSGLFPAGCVIRDLAFMQASGATRQSGSNSFIYINDANQIRVQNVHMLLPNIGISIVLSTSNAPGQFWIQDVLIEGVATSSANTPTGGIFANAGNGTLYLSHVIMDITLSPFSLAQPQYGIQVQNAGELIICNGTDIIGMGDCLLINPTTGQIVDATYVSDSLFDSGNRNGCVYVAPTGTGNTSGLVATMRFTNVWTSTGNTGSTTPPTQSNVADGFRFVGGTARITDVVLVNCLGKGFFNNYHNGLYASGVQNLSVTASTFGANYNGIFIANGMSNFILNGNKCGPYVFEGKNLNYGIALDGPSTPPTPNTNVFIITNNLLRGNGFPSGYFQGCPTDAANQILANNLY